MLANPRYTPDRLRFLREQAASNFYLFQKGIWGDKDLDEKFHGELCNFLQYDPHKKKLLCGFRGCLKSSTLRAFAAWVGLHSVDWWQDDWSWLWVEQKYELAVEHHRMLQDKFWHGPQAALLVDLYHDRIPRGFAGWNEKHTVLKRLDPVNEKFITIASLDAKLEGQHRNGIICDDLEGADADKSEVPNTESWRFLMDRANHLLKEPKRSMVIVGGTPHGPDPLVWRIRDLEGEGTLENSERKMWGLWWKPYLDEYGDPQWPERYDMEYLQNELALGEVSTTKKRSNETQLFLRKFVGTGVHFNVDALRERNWKPSYVPGPKGVRELVWVYPSEDIEQGTDGEIRVVPVTKQVSPQACRFTIHWDPAHKDRSERVSKLSEYTPSKHGIVVVAYTPDCHALIVDYWKAEAQIDVALEVFIGFYRKYVPWKWNYDPVGAQSWIVSHLETLERYKYRGIKSIATPWRSHLSCRRIARPSRTAEPANKENRNKEEEIGNQLELPVNEGWLHLHEKNAEFWHEFETFGRSEDSFDLLDALSQGPPIWKPAPSPEALLEMKKRQLIRRLSTEREIYTAPWDQAPIGAPSEVRA